MFQDLKKPAFAGFFYFQNLRIKYTVLLLERFITLF